jgi:multidrug efflux pump
MKRLNLSEWALNHRGLVLYFMIALFVGGAFAFTRLGQSEDPPFTFKVMVVNTKWPGATAREVEEQITDKIEKKLQEESRLDHVSSYSKAGESMVFFVAKDSEPSSQMPDIFYQVRKKVGDIRHTLPAGVQGPYINDEFGEVYGNIYALSGEGFSYADLERYADRVRQSLLRVPDVAKVDLFGVQDQRIYIELSNTKLATLGVDVRTITDALVQQNAVTSAGFFETPTDRIYLRPSGDYGSVESIRETTVRAGGRLFRIGDIARVYRGYVEPSQPRVRFQGKEALAVGVSMAKGGDIIALGKRLDAAVARIRTDLPVGLELQTITSQPRAVERSVGEFIHVLAEAVAIVLIVSLASLGMRTGFVVAISIPVVLAATFLVMNFFGIGLHKISLGALILALGLLVDDAIIAVEMMAAKMEQGWERFRAASFAYTSTAWPMLTGTLVTVAGFLPIATAASSVGEYTRSIFQVTAIALAISWIAAVLFVPYLGYRLLPDRARKDAPRGNASAAHHDIYQTAFYRRFRRLVEWCVGRRKTVIATTLAVFAISLIGFRLVPQQFFPDSTRPELLVDLRLAQGSSYAATEGAVKKLEHILAREDGIENFVAYVGSGSPRFYLPLDQQLANENFAQFVVLAKSFDERERLRAKLIELFKNDFPTLRASIARLENGPPVGFPVQFRVSGEDVPTVRRFADRVAEVMRANPHLSSVQFDWDEKSKVIRLDIDQDKARLLGLSSQELSTFLDTSLNGLTVTRFRERDKSIEVMLRGAAEERARLSYLQDLAVPTRAGKSVPLAQIARISYSFENGIVWRRDRVPTVTVRANVYDNVQAPAVTAEILPQLEPIKADLPAGYRIATGGAVEESAKGQASVMAGMPLFVFVVLTVLMLQLQSFQRVLIVVLTAPLGMIGVTLFLLVFNQPFGFVAMLGAIALSGMIMRNSVILVDQIEQDRAAGAPLESAIVEATVRRFRPIVLTAATAVLAMIPLSRSAFFGPMAVAIMGGLIVATALTLLFLPALYAAWFRAKAGAPAAVRGDPRESGTENALPAA